MDAPALEVRGVRKAFGQNRVLDNVDFTLLKGEIHALLGGNGAGKSTLMKIISGVYTLDDGSILVDGRPRRFLSAHDAQGCGIATVFQEFSLIPSLSVAQNIFLTREPRTRLRLLDDRACERRAAALLAEMGVEIDPRAPVGNLSTGHQQVTEIAKALSQGADVLILDEPSSSLTKRETESFFHLLRRLKARGIAIIYISHRLEEIFEIADRITVLRDGRRVLTAPVADMTMPRVIEGIVGRQMEQSFEWKERSPHLTGTPLLEVRQAASNRGLRGASLQLYPGEILGIAGLMGSGRTALARCLFGIDRLVAGELWMRGRRVAIDSPAAAIKAGIALIPEDRRRQGLVLRHTISANVVLSMLNRLLWGGLMNDRRADQVAASFVLQLAIKTESIATPVELLSGGNQQKVVIAKWLATEPHVLIMDEPTSGVDIGTKTQIIAMIRRLADQGKGIIVISSELPELLAVSDRILVMRDGVSDRLVSRREIDEEARAGHLDEQQAAAGVAGAEEVLQRIVQGV